MSGTHEQMDDMQLAAFVDGELDAAAAARIEALLQQDAALAARVARQRELRAQLRTAYDAVLDEPLPDRLLAAIEGRSGAATPIGAARRVASSRAAPAPLWWGAAAACMLVAVLIGWSLPRGGGVLLIQADQGLVAGGALDAALSGAVSGSGAAGSEVQVTLTFRGTDGRFCRAFRLASGVDGLACRTSAGRWQVEATGHAPASGADEYRQATSILSPSVVAAISGRQQDEVLAPEEERQLLERGWR